MKFFLDTANLEEMRTGVGWGIVDGVTTNSILIAKESKPLEEHIREICDLVDGDISAELVETKSGPMIEQGRELAKIHKNGMVKCPLTREGIKATSALSGDGIRVNVTLFFSAAQAVIAAKDDVGFTGMDPAALRSPTHVIDSALAGSHIGAWHKTFQEKLAAR